MRSYILGLIGAKCSSSGSRRERIFVKAKEVMDEEIVFCFIKNYFLFNNWRSGEGRWLGGGERAVNSVVIVLVN